MSLASSTRWICLAGVAVLLAISSPGLAAIDGTPQALFETLKKPALWRHGLPVGFRLEIAGGRPLHEHGLLIGEVLVGLRGPDRYQGLAVVVTNSARTAHHTVMAAIRSNHAVRSLPRGAYGWLSLETGSSSECGVARLRCYESFRFIQSGVSLLTVMVGSLRRPDAHTSEHLRQLLRFGLAQIKRADNAR